MRASFLMYERRENCLMFIDQITVDYPDCLQKMSDPIQSVKEDENGLLYIESLNHVYIQNGYTKGSHENTY